MRKLLPARVAAAEQRARHSSVLRRIEAAPGATHDAIEGLEQVFEPGALVRKIERQCDPFARKRQHAGRAHGAETLQDREK